MIDDYLPVATRSMYCGDGFDIPNLWINRRARNGATLSW